MGSHVVPRLDPRCAFSTFSLLLHLGLDPDVLVLRSLPGYVIASTLWIIVNKVWPPPGLGQVDSEETFAAFEAEDTVKSVDDEEKVEPSTERSAAPQGALSFIRG